MSALEKVTRVVVRSGRTVNTGNYNSARFEFEMEASVIDDDAELIYSELYEYLVQVCDDEADRLMGK